MKSHLLLGITLATAVTFNTNAQVAEADEWLQNGTRLELNTNFDELKMNDGTDWMKYGVNGGSARFEFTTSSALTAFRFNRGIELSSSLRSYNSALTFYTMSSNVPRLHLATNGDVAIGHNTPQAKLDVKGDILLSGTHKVLKTLDGEMCISSEEGLDLIIDNNDDSQNNAGFRIAKAGPGFTDGAGFPTENLLFQVKETGLTTALDFKVENLADANATSDRFLGVDANGNLKVVPTPTGGGGNQSNNFTGSVNIDQGILEFTNHQSTQIWAGWSVMMKAPWSAAWVTSNKGNSGEHLGIGMTTQGWYFILNENELGWSASNATTPKYPFYVTTNGLTVCREVLVTQNGWSDFVFESDYKLDDLEMVETYIKENKHLPNVPSEKEVVENGVELGKMDAILLRKIEELTLYIIEQNKKIKALERK
jgi:hypothetical protein